MSTFKPADSCVNPVESHALSVEAARARIAASLTPVHETESLDLHAALGRVLAEPIVAPIDVPPHDNSAMDGYALRSADLHEQSEFTVVGSAMAGHPYAGKLPPAACVRIMTGGVVPDGADMVVMQEQVEVLTHQRVRIHAAASAGQHIRRAGEDIPQGFQVFEPGRRIRPSDLGVLASLGMPTVRVYRKIQVAFFSTGDELTAVGQALQPGQLFDSNRYSLYGLLQDPCLTVHDLGVIADTQTAIAQAMQTASQIADVVISTGGVSVGDADFVHTVLSQLGTVEFWKIAMKPGRPLTVGHLGKAVFFGLPGNPVSMMVTFSQFVREALQRLCHATPSPALRLRAQALGPIHKRAGRFEFQRGVLHQSAEGSLTVEVTGDQGSGRLSSMAQANCFILLEPNNQGVNPGEWVWVEPFSGL